MISGMQAYSSVNIAMSHHARFWCGSQQIAKMCLQALLHLLFQMAPSTAIMEVAPRVAGTYSSSF